jgi:hypothetical protein
MSPPCGDVADAVSGASEFTKSTPYCRTPRCAFSVFQLVCKMFSSCQRSYLLHVLSQTTEIPKASRRGQGIASQSRIPVARLMIQRWPYFELSMNSGVSITSTM